jgi:hypothetical protein
MPPGAMSVGLADGDVDSREAHGLTRTGKAAGVAEFSQDDRGQDRPDTPLALQNLTAVLAAGEASQLGVQRSYLGVECVDHP